MEKDLNQKPCAAQKVETSQGFSVSYNGQFLYSKYNPSKNIIAAVERLELLPGTIILGISPLLGYGLSELTAKLPENCLILLCEAEKSLYDFSKTEGVFNTENPKIKVCAPEELSNLPIQIYNYTKDSLYKRVIRFDMSAGVQLHKEFYDNLYSACTDSVMTFWKNRITLTKFGRRYSKNIFENLKYLGESKPITDYFASVEKPVIVFGAGQSTQTFLDENKISSEDYFILCADTALQPLLKSGIKPDGVFIEEAQSVITKAFIGIPEDVQIFAGLSSIPNIAHKFRTGQLSYFYTEFTKAAFLDNLKSKSFMPPQNQPFGSVGLTAVYYALKFRKNKQVPVYVTGLDFSYSAGITHTRGALAQILRVLCGNRLQAVTNFSSAFGIAAEKISDKAGNVFITTPTLKSYAMMFNHFFANEKNLFDAGKSGIPLAIPHALPEPSDRKTVNIKDSKYSDAQKKEIVKYLEDEKTALEYLRDLLTGKTDFKGEELTAEIVKTAEPREYLYLHFADGYRFAASQSFLNRIRTEIDFFIKYM